MAEIRKHDPKVTNQIDAAILAAMGEDIRPATPGEHRAPRPTEATQGAPRHVSITGISTGAGYVELPPALRPKAAGPVVPPQTEES